MDNKNRFISNQSAFTARMAQGHVSRKGHNLTGFYTEVEPGIQKLVRTCCPE